MTEELAYLPASELADRISRRSLSPVEVVEYFLERIDERDDEINAFVTVCDERAREAAEAAEAALEVGDDVGPLHGVPVAVKDLTNVADVPTTFGSEVFEEFVPDKNDLMVDRLEEAGAIVIGKTNTPEFGRKPMTTNRVCGATGNPWDPEKSVGGSSGGSAAALADGMVPLATGSDAAGSLRIPAAACGVVSIVADFGRVPIGTRPDAFVDTHPYTFVGPMARTVEDAALLLDVMTGPSNEDPFSLPAPPETYRSATRETLEGIDIAYSPDLGICEISAEVADVVGDAIDAFEPFGGAVETVDDVFTDWTRPHDALEVLLQDRYRGMYENFIRDEGIDLLERTDVTEEVVSRIEKSLTLGAGDVRHAERVRTGAYDTMRSVFEEYDLLVTPTMGLLPFKKGTKPRTIDGAQVDPLHGWALTWPLNLTGNPTTAVPAGFAEGLPVGLQIIGPRLADRQVVAAAAAYERVRPWHDRRPSR